MAQERHRFFNSAGPAVAVAGVLATAFVLGTAVNRPVTAQDTASVAASQIATATALEGAFTRVAETVGPATVSITATERVAPKKTATGSAPPADGDPFEDLFGPRTNPFRRGVPPRGSFSSGSGILIRADGYVLTNDHVVEDAQGGAVTVTLQDGSIYKGRVLRDARSDIAVVKIDADRPLPFVRLADSGKVRVGQWAIAIGSPFGQQNTMTTGIVSALHRRKEITDGMRPRLYPNLIQTDAPINPGNSGGPLLNINGDLVGINVAIFSPTQTSIGIGYAIPANAAKVVADQLIARGKVTRGSLGVIPTDVPAGLRKRLGTSQGAYVGEVKPDTPAERAGIAADDVIVRFGERTIANESDLRESIAATAPGTKVGIAVLHSGKEQTVTATLDAFPEDPEPAVVGDGPVVRRPVEDIGVEVGSLTASAISQMNLPSGTKGVLVKRVQPGSPAQQAELTPDSVVTAVDGTAVATIEGLDRALRAAKPGDTVTLLILRYSGEAKPSHAAVNIMIP
jgi:serine protease Do